MGLKEAVKQLLVKKIEKEYEKLLSQKKISYQEWVEERELLLAAECEKAAEESPLGSAGEYVLFLQKNGQTSKYARLWIDAYMAKHPETEILYGDEDFMDAQGVRTNPWYKPCWSPDTYLSQFYFGSVIVVKRALVEAVISESEVYAVEEIKSADERVFFEEPNRIRPLITACIQRAGGFNKGCKKIAGCDQVLFHVTQEQVWEKYLASDEALLLKDLSVEGCTKDTASSEKKTLDPVDLSDISVIIPSKDNPEVLGKCLEALKSSVQKKEQSPDGSWKTSGPEIIVVDNGSSEENRKKIEQLTKEMTYIYQPMEFNFSRMCNLGVEASTGKYLLFLNDDIEVCGEEWLYAMKAKASLPYVGGVGLKLYYPDSIRMQHAGITNLPVGPVHKMQFTLDDRRYYFDRNKVTINCLAVTAACLLIDKAKYLEVGGLKESLRVAYNDVELGFSLYEAGYQNVVINTHYAYHHESLSRGSDETREKQARLQKEREHLYEMHPLLNGRDPYYPDLLHKDGPDVRIVPGYINARNTVQEAKLCTMSYAPEQIRVDNCLMAGIEVSEKSVIKGYGVVLGDNNACYDRYIVLVKAAQPDTKALSISGDGSDKMQDEQLGESAWLIPTKSQYRQDLEENIPDQKNVALSGFHVQISKAESEKLEKDGRYLMGILAVHKINKGKLLNFSSRYYINE